MTVSSSDIKFRKAVVQTDTDANGGRKGTTLVTSGARHALFPRVTKSQRESGLVRYRKEFYCNENADDQSAYGILIYMMCPSNAGDRFYLAEGTQLDTQSTFKRKTDIDTFADSRFDRMWTGSGPLETALSGGEEEVSLTMENDDFQFPNNGYLYLSNNVMASQTIDDDVSIGNSVYYSSGSWSKISHTDDIDYPNGWCIGENTVLTIQETTNVEFLQIADNHYSGEVIGTGDGTTQPALSTLTHVTNGICRQPDMLPVITATTGSGTKTVTVAADGSCSGDCTGGQLNIGTGVWDTDITWSAAPTNGTDITADYRERAFSYSGNVVTVELQEQVANSYDVDETHGGGCVYSGEVACSVSDWEITSGSGTFDDDTYPVLLYNDGTVEETWTLTVGNAGSFSVSGPYYGSLANGSIGSTYSPTNSDTGQPYFTLTGDAWGGSWENGDQITFKTHPSAVPMLLEQLIPAGTGQEPNNVIAIGTFTE